MTADADNENQSEQSGSAHGSICVRILQQLSIDRATFYAISLRAWQLLAGTVTAVLIAWYFSKAVQGYHYTFSTLLALQTFFDLSFSVVVINVASHEWSGLQLDSGGRISGPPANVSRLVSLGRLLFGWYAVAAVAFVVLVGTAGAWFLARDNSLADWAAPWWLLTVATGLLMWTLPFNALLEGCNQVAAVNRMRIQQAVVGNVVTWIVILAGGQLWAIVGSAVARLGVGAWFLLSTKRAFFERFRDRLTGPVMSWKNELWPLQWRLALQSIAGYFAFSIFVPVMFEYHGAEVSGQMGMTWTLLTAIQAAAIAWVQTRAPRFGILISRGEFRALDQLFRRLAIISTSMITLAGLGIYVAVAAFQATGFFMSERLLSPTVTLVFVLASIVFHIPRCLDLYIRAHKRDPLLAVNLLGSSLIGCGVWYFGRQSGPSGAAVSYLVVTAAVVLPGYLWATRNIRRQQERDRLEQT